MNPEDYVLLQTLLAKARVISLKIYGDKNTKSEYREKNLKIVRNIDYLRKNIEVNLNNCEDKTKMFDENYDHIPRIN